MKECGFPEAKEHNPRNTGAMSLATFPPGVDSGYPQALLERMDADSGATTTKVKEISKAEYDSIVVGSGNRVRRLPKKLLVLLVVVALAVIIVVSIFLGQEEEEQPQNDETENQDEELDVELIIPLDIFQLALLCSSTDLPFFGCEPQNRWMTCENGTFRAFFCNEPLEECPCPRDSLFEADVPFECGQIESECRDFDLSLLL